MSKLKELEATIPSPLPVPEEAFTIYNYFVQMYNAAKELEQELEELKKNK